MADTYMIQMIVRGIDKPLRQSYDDEAARDTAFNQLKAGSSAVDFGGWHVKPDHIIALRKDFVKGPAE